MDFQNFKTGNNDISRRLDKVIRIFAEDLSLAEIYKAIRKGFIKVNNKKIKSDYRIQKNDIISIAAFLTDKANNEKKESTNEESVKMPEIIFENEYILVINKPYDVNVHGDKTSLDKTIENYYNQKVHQASLSFKPGPLHRLDKKTTGLLAFSMNIEGARWFSENIKNHTIQKKYYGLIEGNLSRKEIWCDFISNERSDKICNMAFHKVNAILSDKKGEIYPKDNCNQHINKNEVKKQAETVVIPIGIGKYKDKDVTLAEFYIKTGRKHQIRAQSSLHKHPLLGDTAYGGKKINYGNRDFYLTAKELIFPKDNPLNLPEKLNIELEKSFINILEYCDIKKRGV